MVKTDKCIGIPRFVGGRAPGLPPESMPWTWNRKSFIERENRLLLTSPVI